MGDVKDFFGIERVVSDDNRFWDVVAMRAAELREDDSKVWVNGYTPENEAFADILNHFSRHGSLIYVSTDAKGKSIGYSLGGVHSGLTSPSGRRAFEVFRLFIEPGYRGKGLSYHTVTRMLTHAKEEGFEEVFAEVPLEDRVAERVFRKLHFNFVGCKGRTKEDYSELTHKVYSREL